MTNVFLNKWVRNPWILYHSYSVDLEPMLPGKKMDIDQWCSDNIGGKWYRDDHVWYFKNLDDATYFRLYWT